MITSRRTRTHGQFRARYFEALETRVLMAAAPPLLEPPAGLTFMDPTTIPQFVNDITAINPFVDGFHYTPDNFAGNHYTIGAYPIVQDLGLGINPATGEPYMTPLFGYGSDADHATYPGMTLEVQRNQPIAVTWVNGLPTRHVVNIDPTLMGMGMPGMEMTYNAETNELFPSIPIVTHLHGGHTDAIYDGTPEQWYTAEDEMGMIAMGMDYIDTQEYNPTQPANTFTYRNDQDAATLWYHDHAMGVTRLNAYAGMAGFYIIRDQYDTGEADNPLGLPAGPYEFGMAIQDKQFLSDGQVWFAAEAQTWDDIPNVASTLPEQFGDTILVNGKAWPTMTVEARRYRFRVVNASDSRFYTISIDNLAKGTVSATPMWQIGTDQGLLNNPVKSAVLTIAPGERVDFVVDFSKFKPGTRLVMGNSAVTPFPAGAPVVPGLTDRIMAFDIVAASSADTSTPMARTINLRPDNPIPAPGIVSPTRQMALYETTDAYGRITPLLGTPESSAEFMDPITEWITYNPAGTTEVWQIFNNTADTHPIHLHQVAFQILTRQTFATKLTNLGVSESGVTMWGMGNVRYRSAPVIASGNEFAWKDTIMLNPGEVITLRATFDLPGKYVTHCHILSHEEHDMMRYMQVGEEDFPEPGLIVDGSGAVVTLTATPSLSSTAPATSLGLDTVAPLTSTTSSISSPSISTSASRGPATKANERVWWQLPTTLISAVR